MLSIDIVNSEAGEGDFKASRPQRTLKATAVFPYSAEMTAKLFIISAILGLPFMVHGFSDGAPSSQCVAMMPHHMVDPQKAAFPYVISFDKNPIKPGETVGVTIKGKTESDNFKGLLVQARVGNTPIGKFDVSSSAQYLQLMDCGNSKGVSDF